MYTAISMEIVRMVPIDGLMRDHEHWLLSLKLHYDRLQSRNQILANETTWMLKNCFKMYWLLKTYFKNLVHLDKIFKFYFPFFQKDQNAGSPKKLFQISRICSLWRKSFNGDATSRFDSSRAFPSLSCCWPKDRIPTG